ncbi:MAG: response regulator [Planctomycetia bacterium]|uniref:response regulator n=1 Tax=Candidatus Kuenenia sp. TaxID=2499824 RepID=UPI001DA01C11|nr:response regulator [Planctomycetia bacterium]GJQ49795.1 MAG: hypothetical protein HKUEN01_21810 [Candidatus Kuenenia stuttgartiensis]
MKQKTILIVDDEKNILATLKRILEEEKEGYRVFFADSGIKGLEILKCENIHLIITNYRMPGMDGLQVLKRATMLSPDAVKFMLTGYADLDVVMKAKNEGGVYRFFTKPWSNNEILGAVKQAFCNFDTCNNLEFGTDNNLEFGTE